MNGDVFSHVFRIELQEAEAALSHLAHLGLLDRHGSAYRVAPHLRGPLQTVLRDRGWL